MAVARRGLRKKYPGERGVQALETISVDVPAGRFVSILGPSGCGKSTFLRCVAGLETISEGELRVAGQPVKGPPDGIG
ncbi:ATP-binding cassette domain-containing protein, partial [Bordetella bronchiseptica]|uniref:ATP-binding cassette domain-containing protein n=1 Tax=Bordetella bronchiseptica TaxID=518 RepID=UPI0012903016